MNEHNNTSTTNNVNYYDIEALGNGSHAHVVDLTPFGSKVLELGAGSGIISMTLEQKKGATATALDLHPSEMLLSRLKRVFEVNLNDKDWPKIFSEEEKFDIIIAADVLEHLYDPLRALLQMKELLNPKGSIILSLPNASHAGVIAALLNNNFEYRPEGLLDNTHIRFFGLENIEELHRRAGLTVTDARFVVMKPEDTELRSQWKKLSYRQKTAIAEHREGLIYQIIVKSVQDTGIIRESFSLSKIPIEIDYTVCFSPFKARIALRYSEFLCSLSKIIQVYIPSIRLKKIADRLHNQGSKLYQKTLESQ